MTTREPITSTTPPATTSPEVPRHRSTKGTGALSAPRLTVVDDATSAGVAVAERILDRLEAAEPGRPFYLGCPAGRTPVTTYRALGRLAAERGADLSRLVITMVDEYVVDTPEGFVVVDPAMHFSCRRHVTDDLLRLVNADLPPHHRVAEDRVRFPDPADPAAFDAFIASVGGIDLFLLASGATDGHVAFNPPGTDLDSPTRIVELADSTRRDNLATFPRFGGIDEVPRFGVSIGLAAIVSAKETVLLLLGADKAGAFRRLMRAHTFESEWPATVIYACAQASIIVDAAAAQA